MRGGGEGAGKSRSASASRMIGRAKGDRPFVNAQAMDLKVRHHCSLLLLRFAPVTWLALALAVVP